MRVKIIKGILIAIVVCAVLTAGIFVAYTIEKRSGAPAGAGTSASYMTPAPIVMETPEPTVKPVPDDAIYYNGKPYVPNTALSTMLIMGIDDVKKTKVDSYRNDSQADFLLLAVFNNDNKTCTLLHINRDTMADVPVKGALGGNIGLTHEQIALAHTYGTGMEDSCENTVDAVSRLLYDTTIDNYIALTMGGITVLNDLVGGVTVTVEDDFTGVDDTLIRGSSVKLMGEHAENFVRSRMSMSEDASNLARMRRQRTYMVALAEQLKAAVHDNSAFALSAYAALADYLMTDCDINQLISFGERFSDYAVSGIVSPEGEARKGVEFMEFHVDENALQKLIIDLFYLPVEQ